MRFSSEEPLRKVKMLSLGAELDSMGPVRASVFPSLPGICKVYKPDGGCISVLKTLFTNYCENRCAYCVNRVQNDIPRTSFRAEELADLAYRLYERGYIGGLFLTSAIFKDPDYTMELMIRSAKILRQDLGFKGYLHLKVLPGVSEALMREAVALADRVSVNLEFTEESSFNLFTPDKSRASLLRDLVKLSHIVREVKDRGSRRVGQSTQIIVGATIESDLSILKTSFWLYKELELDRVYYSAYVPVNRDVGLPPGYKGPPELREHRLYQADFLIRRYGFSIEELFPKGRNDLPENVDPKLSWALRNLSFFPVEITKASYEELLRVPGIGPISAKRIIEARRERKDLSLEDLRRMGVAIKRAKGFITVNGRSLGGRKSLSLREFEETGSPQTLPLFEL